MRYLGRVAIQDRSRPVAWAASVIGWETRPVFILATGLGFTTRTWSEHVSGAAEFPLTAQTYFCDSRSPLRDLDPLPLTRFLARSSSAPLVCSNMFQAANWKSGQIFYRASSYDSAVLAVVIQSVRLSVCLCVCHTRALWQNQTMYCIYFDTTRKGNHAILTPTVIGGRRPIRVKFALKVTQPFKTRRLGQISAYNISTV